MKKVHEAYDMDVMENTEPPFGVGGVRELWSRSDPETGRVAEFVSGSWMHYPKLYEGEDIQEVIEEIKCNEKETFVLRADAQAPYDGCWWEPNYFLLKHEEGNGWWLYPLYCSHNEFKNTAKWAGDPDRMRLEVFLAFLVDCPGYPDYKDLEIYAADDRLYRHIHCNFWSAIVTCDYDGDHRRHQTHGSYGIEWTFKWKCPECGKLTDDMPETVGHQGNGGVGIEVTDVVCQECKSIHSCGYCGEYCDPNARDKWSRQYDTEVGCYCYSCANKWAHGQGETTCEECGEYEHACSCDKEDEKG